MGGTLCPLQAQQQPWESGKAFTLNCLSLLTSQGASSVPSFPVQCWFGEVAPVSALGSERLGHLLTATQHGNSRSVVHTYLAH